MSKNHRDNVGRKEADITIASVDSGQRDIPDDVIEGDESRNLAVDGMLRVGRRFKQSKDLRFEMRDGLSIQQ